MAADTIRASVLTGFVETARAVGLDPLSLIDAAGIPRQALTDPDLRISLTGVRDMLERCGVAADDFGLRMAERRTPSVMGPVALIAREQPTVRRVVQAISDYHFLHADTTSLTIEDLDEVSVVRVVHAWARPGPSRQAVDLALGQIMRAMQTHIGLAWRPLSASFAYAAPKDVSSHRRLFGRDLAFDQEFNGLVFRRADLDRPNPIADPEMARLIERYIEDLGGSGGAGLADRVRAVVLRDLASGRCTAEEVSRQMGLDLRTLQRQLAAAKTTFGSIVQEARMTLVPQYLLHSDRSLAEVSDLLGFSALSAFSRWHRTHYGLSASAHRQAARSGPDHAGQGA